MSEQTRPTPEIARNEISDQYIKFLPSIRETDTRLDELTGNLQTRAEVYAVERHCLRETASGKPDEFRVRVLGAVAKTMVELETDDPNSKPERQKFLATYNEVRKDTIPDEEVQARGDDHQAQLSWAIESFNKMKTAALLPESGGLNQDTPPMLDRALRFSQKRPSKESELLLLITKRVGIVLDKKYSQPKTVAALTPPAKAA